VNAAAKEIERRAAEWLEKREREEWSAQDQVDLDSWKAASVAHRVAFVRMNAAWSRTERLAALRPESAEQEVVTKRRWRAAIGATVALGVIFTAVIGARGVLPGARENTYSTPIGGHTSVVLADGSRIDLNTDTILRARVGARGREVWLDRGEAYFQVKHDAMHPFVVMASGHRITDLGTKFLVRRNASGIEVTLTEGRLRFESADAAVQAHSALLIPGDTVIATSDSIAVAKKSTQELSTELGWRQGLLVFKYATLADAAAEFNRYNRKKLVIADQNAAHLTIVGTFPTNGVEAFARVSKEVFGLHVENLRDEIVIAR
jgi:transmembrane sensor